jgi:hypothetical protein
MKIGEMQRLLGQTRVGPTEGKPDAVKAACPVWGGGSGNVPATADHAVKQKRPEVTRPTPTPHALRYRLRGLSVRSSLAQLLARERAVGNVGDLSELTENLILSWADRHKRRTGRWPTENSGPLADAPGEVWANVNAALIQGLRGLPGGCSLAVLLATHCGVRNRASIPPLTQAQILKWADRYHEQTGRWPKVNSGAIAGAAGETWVAMDDALRNGLRGLPGGSSLALLLLERRGVRSLPHLPRLTLRDIRRWARAHRRRKGKWPTAASGPIPEAPGGELARGQPGALQRSPRAAGRLVPGEAPETRGAGNPVKQHPQLEAKPIDPAGRFHLSSWHFLAEPRT